MVKRIIALPGFNTDGNYMQKIRLEAIFRNYRFTLYNPMPRGRTGLGNLLANRFFSLDAKVDCALRLIEIRKELGDEIHLWCHSNGLAVAYLIDQEKPGLIKSVTAFNGALNADAKFNCHVSNFYYTKDFWLKFAKIRPGHIWGNYGANPECGDFKYCMDEIVKGHSDFHHHLDLLAPIAIEAMRACCNDY